MSLEPDLLLTNGVTPDGDAVDIAIQGETLAAIGPGIASALAAKAGAVEDLGGRLVTPPFVDAHFHLDATLSIGQPRRNLSGTLLEGIALWGELKPLLTHEAVIERALRYIEIAVGQGILAIRTHVDVCDPRLLGVEALVEVKRRVAPVLDLQLVACPQDGWHRSAQGGENVVRALDLGADVVGGIPHFERTMADGADSVAAACRLAAERGVPVDLHCDESDDPLSRHIETLAAETLRHGLQGRVTGSHLTAMHSYDPYYAAKLIPLIAEAGVAAIANPLINITLQGRMEGYPKRRGMTRVPELLEAGVPLAMGQDCMLDPWYALGTADMLDVAHMGLHVAQMTSLAGMRRCFDLVTAAPAAILGLDDWGLRDGARASLVVLDAPDPVEALRRRPARTLVVSRGRIVSRTTPAATAVTLGL